MPTEVAVPAIGFELLVDGRRVPARDLDELGRELVRAYRRARFVEARACTSLDDERPLTRPEIKALLEKATARIIGADAAGFDT